jgi:hypothetical protein
MQNPYTTGEITVRTTAHITGVTGAQNLNIFQLNGAVRVVEQYAIITEATTLTNCTNVYADLWDGTNSEVLTLDGATLSGVSVGTIFTKDKDVTQAYSVIQADQCRVNEVVDEKKLGKPFTVSQKYNTDTFMRFNFTTTDNPINFKMFIKFVWEPVNGGYLTLL